MKRLWNSLLNIGILPELPAERIRKIRLLNGILLTGEIFVLLLITRSVINQRYLELYIQTAGIILFAVPIFFNYLHRYRIAKYLCLLIPIVYLSLVTVFWGSERGSHLIIFAVTGLAVLFFENRKTIVFFCILAAVGIISVEVYNFYNDPIYVTPNVEASYLINVFITITLIIVITGIFKTEIYAFQEQISSINKEMRLKNLSMAELNKSLAHSVKLIKDQKEAINLAHERLQDSIDYARTIQQSILSVPADLKQLIPEYFILFKPLKVVSGDFYYFNIKEETVLVAAVDCTGHGVPGAFMSLIGYNALQEAVEVKKLHDPSEILGFLNERIHSILKQGSSSNSDGMDIGILSLNTLTREITFSGAKISLIIATNNEVLKIKGNRFSIGGYTPAELKFDSHEMKLQKNDCLYLMSDGLQDQFGGPDNKRFKTSRIIGLIQNIHSDSMMVQKEKFIESLNAWSENNEQTDDILLLGIRA